MGGQQFKKTSPTQKSSLQQLQPAVTKGTPKLKDICVSLIPQRAMKAIILEICTDTTSLLQIKHMCENNNGLDTEHTES